jgi:translation initiation factor 1
MRTNVVFMSLRRLSRGKLIGMSESRRVYSTADGDLRKPSAPKAASLAASSTPNDGIVRVSRETSGRRGKTVTVVRGVPRREVDAVASDLKRQCGSGGSAKDGVVEIQGDHRRRVVARLEARGYRVKHAGG